MLKTIITPEMHYDDWATAYDGDVRGWDYHAPDAVLRKASEFIQRHKEAPRILDVGIGTGLFSEKCRAVRSDVKISGIDISSRMLEICAAKNIADELHRTDISADMFPFADNSFDLTAAAGVMENVENAENAIREMARVTRPGGLVLFTYMPSASHPLREEKTMAMRPGRTPDGRFVMGKLTLFRHSPHKVIDTAKTSGLRPHDTERFVGYRTFVIVTVLYDLFCARKVSGLQ